MSLEEDELQIGQRHEDVERKREYYHITYFPQKDLKFYFKIEENK